MAQSVVNVNLNAAVIPFSAAFKGQSVIMANRGDMSTGPARDFSGDTLEAASNWPQLYWAENVMPSQEGYFSVGYQDFIPAIPDTVEVDYEITLFDGESNKGVFAVTKDKGLWLLSGVGGTWMEINLPDDSPAWTGRVTTGVAYGFCYLFFPGAGLHKLSLIDRTLVKVTPVGLDEDVVIGITDSQSYLIAYSQNLIAWSSALDALDFVPSDITGAGAGTPEGLRGQIVFCKPISKGFVIYTSALTMAGEYTGNARFPWIFRVLNRGGGVNDAKDVSQDASISSHFVWGTTGLSEVSIQQCAPRFPQLTDFLAGQSWEEYDAETDSVKRTALPEQVKVRIALIASRFLCISYGKPWENHFTFVNVFDTELKRWGRLRINHVQCFEIVADTEQDPISWDETEPETWDEATTSWNSYVRWNNGTAKAKNTIGFIQSDGSIKVAQMHFNVSGSEGLIILGRMQLVRGHTSLLHTVLVQGVNRGDSSFIISDRVTQADNGVSFTHPLNSLTPLSEGDFTRMYGSRVVGKNHNLIAQGNFHLCSMELAMSDAGRR